MNLAATSGWRIPHVASAPPACDPYFNNVVLLLHGRGEDGSDNGQDSSKYLDDRTLPAGLSISVDQARFGLTSLKCVYRQPTDLLWEDDRFIRLPGVPYTIELWFLSVSSVNVVSSPLIYRHMQSGVVQTQVSKYGLGDQVQMFTGAGPEEPRDYSGGGWHHLAIAYDGSTDATLYLDGVGVAIYGGGAAGAIDGKFYVIGFGDIPDTTPIEFYIQELRVTNGVNRYPANFTPPTEPFPDVACP